MITTQSQKHFRVGYHRLFPLFLTIFLSALNSGWAEKVTVYLPVVGPPPLRFLPEEKPHTNVVVSLPPTPVQPVAPPPVIEKAPPPPQQVPVVQVEASSKPGPANPVVEAPRTDGVVSPQMLLKYFNHPTNTNSGGINAPLDFTPPRAVEAPSSKAEYSTPPH